MRVIRRDSPANELMTKLAPLDDRFEGGRERIAGGTRCSRFAGSGKRDLQEFKRPPSYISGLTRSSPPFRVLEMFILQRSVKSGETARALKVVGSDRRKT